MATLTSGIRVTLNSSNTIILKNEPAAPSTSLAGLTDVITSGVQNGYVLAYSSDLNKYILEPINKELQNAILDGGSF